MRTSGHAGFLVLLLTFMAPCPAPGVTNSQYRSWTSRSGTRIEARVDRYIGQTVYLVTKDGSPVRIGDAKLSKADRDYLREFRQAKLSRTHQTARTTRQSAPTAEESIDAPYLTPLEKAILVELNLARTQPKTYRDLLKAFRATHAGGKNFKQGDRTLVTKEGLAAVDEAIRFLEDQPPLDPLVSSKALYLAARDHALDTGPRGLTGHTGSDGSSHMARIERHGKWKKLAGENIAYGQDGARGIVMGLVIDDGVPSRGHRANIFQKAYGRVGISVGEHAEWTTMCVMDFAGAMND